MPIMALLAVSVFTPTLAAAKPRSLTITVDGAVKLGEWRPASQGLILRQFEAKAGEVYRIDVRWKDPTGVFSLEAWAGNLDEGDLDDASNEFTVPKVGPVSHSAHLKIAVPPSGNYIWFRVQSQGDHKQVLEYRVLATHGAPKNEVAAPGSWGAVPMHPPPEVSSP